MFKIVISKKKFTSYHDTLFPNVSRTTRFSPLEDLIRRTNENSLDDYGFHVYKEFTFRDGCDL